MDSVPPRGSTPEVRASKMRPQDSNHDDPVNSLAATSRNRDKPQKRKPRVTTTHKLRTVETLVTALEYQLQDLQSKWTKQIPDARTRVAAQRCSLEKYAVKQSEIAHRELQEMSQQQQFLLASLQTAVLQSSLNSSGGDILKELHFDTRLGRDPDERERMLKEHNKRSVAAVPSIVEKFSQMAINKALTQQKEADTPMLPLSQIDITGCEDCTLVSSVFVSEIPHVSLEEVYAAAMAYFKAFPAMMKHYFDVEASVRRLNSAESPVAYSQLSISGAALPATVNHVMCSNLTAHHGMIYLDAISEDPLYPVPKDNPLQFGICALTVTPLSEPRAGVMLRRIVLYRYNLLPDNPTLKSDLELNRPIFNGDLIMSAICSSLQNQQVTLPESAFL